jgi:glycosyltransferase involved in cell wall biosynthesis
MHILIIPSELFKIDAYPLGGIFQWQQANALTKHGHRVGILSVGFITIRHCLQRFKYETREEINKIPIFRKYVRTWKIQRFENIESGVNCLSGPAIDLFNKYIKTYGKPDIIHAHNIVYAGLIARELHRRYGIPYLITEHSSGFARGLYQKSIELILQRLAKEKVFLVCVSQSLRRLLQGKIGGEVTVIPNIVNPHFLSAEFDKKNDEEFQFLSIGSLDANKNHEILIRAFANQFKATRLRLVIVGDGPLRCYLRRLTNTLGIEKQVQFYKYLQNELVAEIMQQSDCFVLPSNYETFGVVLIEALASGLPLIASKCGGAEDIVNLSNGLLFDVGSQEQLQNAMFEMVRNKVRYPRGFLRKQAADQYGDKEFVKNILPAYNLAIGYDFNN